MRIIKDENIKSFLEDLINREMSSATFEKYHRDILNFSQFAAGKSIDKQLCLDYKAHLEEIYAVSSANSMIASVNSFFKHMEWFDCCIRQFKVQKKVFCSEEDELTKNEYLRLVKTAQSKGNERLNLVLQTICGTGIRVSEPKYITVEALKTGSAEVSCKGKNRVILIVSKLRSLLKDYVRRHGIVSGPIFVTKNGNPLNRSNIWREMKQLCKDAKVSDKKVFPHNLRHLFARAFYKIEKDIAKLADILGHSSINTTRIYIVSTGAEHRRKMENMRLIV